MYKGSCLCKGVELKVTKDFHFQGNCHCEICRKSHGANHATQGMVCPDGFSILKGKDLISSFESSPSYFRAFCSSCGSRLFNYPESREFYGVALNILDEPKDLDPAIHIYTKSKAQSHVIGDDKPQYEGFPE